MTASGNRPAKDIGRRGEEIYQRDIRHLVEADHQDEFVAIDVDSGEYAVADSVLGAVDRLRSRHPDADAWMVRVGHPTVRTFGAGSLGRNKRSRAR